MTGSFWNRPPLPFRRLVPFGSVDGIRGLQRTQESDAGQCSPYDLAAASSADRFRISSGDTSSMWVATYH